MQYIWPVNMFYFILKFWYIFLSILSHPHILRRRSQRTIRIIQKMGKWSEISVIRIPLTSLEPSKSLQNILSIKVALNFALLVGLFISGRKEKEFIASINSGVRTCLSAFRRLLLKSPIKYNFLFSRFNVVNINISCSVNIVMSVLGGLYKIPTTTFFDDLICDLSNSINNASIVLFNTLSSDLTLKFNISLINKDTPPPFMGISHGYILVCYIIHSCLQLTNFQ